MEDSIRRAEKLVYATNSALAQMKYDLTFEDYKKEPRVSKVPDKGSKNSFLEEELQKYDKDFKSEANEMLSKMDKMFDLKQYSLSRKPSRIFQIRERMREINYKLQDIRQEQTDFRETEQSRLKLLSLINQDEIKMLPSSYTKQISSSNNSETFKNTSSTVVTAGTQNIRTNPILRKTDSLPTIIGNSLNKMKSKEELKNKLLETQEIVDRGFETARHLKQKVESLTNFEKKPEKTPSTLKTCFSENMNATKSFDSTRKSESNETIRLFKVHKCKKHQQKGKKKEDDFERKKKNSKEINKDYEEKAVIKNNSLISIKRAEEKKLKYFKFKIQRLPSLQIKGDLQVQRIHSLEILPKNLKIETNNDNIGIEIISHEEMEKKKISNIVENVGKENCFCPQKLYTNRIECFNCGKLNKVEQNFVDPKEIDNLLMKCSFNVFDPRIDEFVEKYKQTKTVNNFMTELKISDENIKQPQMEEKNENKFFGKETKEKSTQKNVETERTLKIQELSEELTQAYKEKALQLEDDYEEFESILRSLFKKIDKSRQLFHKFENCRVSSSLENKEKIVTCRSQKLTKTKPIIVCLPDIKNQRKDATESSDVERDSPKLHKHYNKKHIFRKKEKLSKNDVKNDFKSKIPENSYKNTILEKFISENKITGNLPKKEKEQKIEPVAPPILSVVSQISEINEIRKKNILEVKTKSFDNEFGLSEVSYTESLVNEKFDITVSNEYEDIKSEIDYESDFEGESIKKEDSKSLESDKIKEENESLIKCTKKLSTILEVDSEGEKKNYEIEFTGLSKEKSMEIIPEKVSKQLPTCSYNDSSQNISNNLNEKLEKDSAFTLDLCKEVDIFETKTGKNSLDLLLSPPASLDNFKVNEKIKNVENNKNSSHQLKNSFQKLSDISKNPSPTKNNSSPYVVSALKDVLFALQDQFHKTQSLAEKLTENINSSMKETKTSEIKSSKNEKEILSVSSSVFENLNFSNEALLTNLQNNRKNFGNGGFLPSESLYMCSPEQKNQNYQFLELPLLQKAETKENLSCTSISKSSSLGNIQLDNLNIVSTEKLMEPTQTKNSSAADINFVKLNLSNSSEEISSKSDSTKSQTVKKGKILSPLSLEEMFQENENESISYSEGEIINPHIWENNKSSTQSIGEVISERILGSSFSE